MVFCSFLLAVTVFGRMFLAPRLSWRVVAAAVITLQIVVIYWADFRPTSAYLLSVNAVIHSNAALRDCSLECRCRSYFDILAAVDKDWTVKKFRNNKFWLLNELQIQNLVAHLRVFGKCFVENAIADYDADMVAQRVLPYFTLERPTVTKWNGEKMSAPKNTDGYWNSARKAFRGKGIAVSMDNTGISEAVGLVKVLRHVNNTLPLQIVHKGDLLEKNRRLLVQYARNDTVWVNGTFSVTGPKQDVYFVDVAKAIRAEYYDNFRSFSNKWLAALFNTFDEMLLMDVDAVPFIKPLDLFLTPQYRTTGALFFRDRDLYETMRPHDTSLFLGLLPLATEEELFNTTVSLDKHRLRNGFFEYGAKHVMESGMVAMKRSSHLTGLFVGVSLQLWKSTSRPVYGDKDLFWLGQLIAGNDMFAFNDRPAAAIGTLEASKNGLAICSSQLAHFDSEDRLLWLNGGLKYCKKDSWNTDYVWRSSLRKSFGTVSRLREHYQTPVSINGAIIPEPLTVLFRDKKIKFLEGNFRKDRSRGCKESIYCAYTSNVSGGAHGKTITFGPRELGHVQTVVDVWNS